MQRAVHSAQIAGSIRHVRSDEKIGTLPKWVPFGQRFRIGNIDGGPDPFRVQRVDQRIGLHHASASGIDKQGALPHQFELLSADQASRLIG